MALNGHATVSVIIDENDEPLPDELAERLRRSHSVDRGFRTVEYLAAALLDLVTTAIRDVPGVVGTEILFNAERLAAGAPGLSPGPPLHYEFASTACTATRCR